MSDDNTSVAITAAEIEYAMDRAHNMIYRKIEQGELPIEVRRHALITAMGIITALAADDNFEAVSWALSYLKKVVDAAEPQMRLVTSSTPKFLN